MCSGAAARLISDDEDSGEEHAIIIFDEETPRPSDVGENLDDRSVRQGNVNVPVHDDEYEWWVKLLAPVPEEQRCKRAECPVAPAGHKRHPSPGRNYSTFEFRIIIQYLVHYEKICYGKGLQVYEEMHSNGYMKHRTVQSLNNNFKKILLRDIRLFELPEDIEAQFVALIP